MTQASSSCSSSRSSCCIDRSRGRSGSCRRRAPAWWSGSAASTARSSRGWRSSSRSSTALRPLIDLREQVVSFPPQPVITEDNLTVNIDSVIYYQVTDPKAATYEIADYIQAIEQLTVTTLRNVIGGMTLEDTLTSRDQINAALRARARRGHRQVGHPREPRRAQGDRPAGHDPGGDGEADARRARPPRRDPPGRGRTSSRRSSPPRARSRARSCGPRASARRRSSTPRASRRRSRRSSRRSTAATPTRSCSPTSTSRCCRRSPRASRTRSGSSRARSRARARRDLDARR